MKNTKIKKYKKINKIRKFALGKPIIKSGYEQALAVDTSPLAINEGYKGYSQEANSIRGGILPQVATSMGAQLLALPLIAKGAVTASAANMTNAATAGFVDAAGKLTELGISALGQGAGAQVGDVLTSSMASKLGEKSAEAVAGAGGNVAKAGLSKLGSALAVALIAKGAWDMGSTIAGYSDRLSDAEIASTATTSTDMRNGVAYERTDAADAGGVIGYTNAQNKASKASMISSGAEIGGGVGALVGTAIPGIGTIAGGLIGTGLGALTNWALDGIFGLGSKRKRAIQDALNRQALFAQASNDQNESNAATQGLRNAYNETHRAALGKNPGERWSADDYTGIQTPSGPAYGAMQGLASPDEGEVDMSTGETNYNGSANPMIQDSKADVIPVGTADNDGQYFDNYIGIPGHKKDIDGIAFADKARPFFKANEMIKMASLNIDEELQKNENHKTRDDATKKYMEKRLKQKQQEYQLQYQQNSQYIQDLVMRQSELTTGRRYSCGKTPRFWGGKPKDDTNYFINPRPSQSDSVSTPPYVLSVSESDTTDQTNEVKAPWYTRLFGNSGDTPQLGLPAWAGLAQGLPYALQTQIAANRQQPYAANSYVSNANQRAALDILGRLGYDNTQDKRALLNAARQNRYNILNTGGLSQGQKAMLIQNGLNQLALGRAALNQDAYNKNAAYKQAYASEMAKYGEASAARAQEALYRQQEAFRQAVGAKQKLQEQARKNWYTIGRQALEDYNTRANAEAMHNLYDRQVAAQEAGIKPELDKSGVNPYSLDYIKSKAQYDAFIKNLKPLTELFK